MYRGSSSVCPVKCLDSLTSGKQVSFQWDFGIQSLLVVWKQLDI